MRSTKLALAFGVLVAGLLAGTSGAQAAGPTAIGVDGAGVVYVGFENGGQIKRYAGSDGTPLAPWGAPGTAPGQLGGVAAIDAFPGPNVWVLDTNRRVQEFTRSGTFIRGVQLPLCDHGSPPSGKRGGLDVSNDSVYAASPCSSHIVRYRLSDLGEAANTSLPLARGLSAQLYPSAPASTQALYVGQGGLDRVALLNPLFFSFLSAKTTPHPTDVFIDAFGVLFATDLPGDKIHLYGSDGNEFRTLGSSGTAAGQLDEPQALDVFDQFSDLAGNVFVADYLNKRIQRWNSFGFTFWTAPADDAGSGGPGPPPVNTAVPQIQGTPTQGNTLTCTQGSWSNSPTGFAYQWLRNGSAIGGANGSTYTVQAADVNTQLTCQVTATNAGGSGQATSAAVTPSSGVQVPVNQTRPAISGSAVVGNTLTCSQGTWSNGPTSFVYEWRRDGATPVGSSPGYTVQAADVGHVLTCSVTAGNAAGSTTSVSDGVTATSGACTGGATGVSIAGGAAVTNSPGVILTIHEPAGATSVVISNDGGFDTPTALPIACDDRYSWTLSTAASGRLSKTVYVRFTGPGIDGDRTFSDDIVLDTAAPSMLAATMTRATSGAAGFVVRLRAYDTGSGVAKVQFASSRNARTQRTARYRRSMKVRYKATARYVRAVDRAGNVGKWRRVKLLKG